MARQFQNKVQFVGIGSNDTAAALGSFVTKHGLSAFPNAADPDGSLRSRLGVAGQPSWIFVDSAGKAERSFGEIGARGLEDRLNHLVGN